MGCPAIARLGQRRSVLPLRLQVVVTAAAETAAGVNVVLVALAKVASAALAKAVAVSR